MKPSPTFHTSRSSGIKWLQHPVSSPEACPELCFEPRGVRLPGSRADPEPVGQGRSLRSVGWGSPLKRPDRSRFYSFSSCSVMCGTNSRRPTLGGRPCCAGRDERRPMRPAASRWPGGPLQPLAHSGRAVGAAVWRGLRAPNQRDGCVSMQIGFQGEGLDFSSGL